MPLRFFDILGADTLGKLHRRSCVDGNAGGESGTVDALDLVELRLEVGTAVAAVLEVGDVHARAVYAVSRAFAQRTASATCSLQQVSLFPLSMMDLAKSLIRDEAAGDEAAGDGV